MPRQEIRQASEPGIWKDEALNPGFFDPSPPNKNGSHDEDHPVRPMILLPFFWLFPVFLTALVSILIVLQVKVFGTAIVLLFAAFLFLAATLWDLTVVHRKRFAALYLIVGFVQNCILIGLLTVFTISLSALIYQVRGIPFPEDLTYLLGYYPQQLSEFPPWAGNFAVSFLAGIASSFFYSFVVKPLKR